MWLRDAPMPGHFAVRLGSRHPWTPALIYAPCPFVEIDPFADSDDWFYPTGRSSGPLQAKIGETETEDLHILLALWQSANPIKRYEYQYLMARRAWARIHEPASYHAKPVNLAVLKNRELI